MSKLTLMLCVLAVGATCYAAEEGVLTPVALSPDEISWPGLSAASITGHTFGKAAEDAGTVNPNAVVCKLQTMFSPVAVAIDSRKADAAGPDVVRFDLTGQGKFADAVVAELRKEGGNNFKIMPVRGQVTLDEQKVPVMLSGSYMNMSGQYRYIDLKVSTGMQGQCRFGDTLRAVRVVDMTCDLRVTSVAMLPFQNGKLMSEPGGDVIVIADAKGSFATPAALGYPGHNVFLDGKAYKVDLSPDGAKISAEPVEVQTGKIRVGHETWTATLLSRNYIFKIAAGEKPVTLPVDHYVFVTYSQAAPPNSRATTLESSAVGTSAGFDVKADEEQDLHVGSPITAAAEAVVAGRQVTFTLKVLDGLGNNVRSNRLVDAANTGRPIAPEVTVLDENSKTIHNGKFEFG
jgi:hypothetical protein